MANQTYEPHKSSIGDVDANVMSIVVYLASVILAFIPYVGYISWAIPLAFFFLEKQSNLVKFHAIQSFILHAISAILGFLISIVIGGIVRAIFASSFNFGAVIAMTSFLGFLVFAVSIVITIFAIIAMIKAYKYQAYHIPLIGKISEKFTSKVASK